MGIRNWRVGVLAALWVAVALCGVQAGDAKPTDEGKAEKFKGKKFDLKEGGKAAIYLTFPAGREFVITVKSDKKSDVNLFVYDADKKVVDKDDSPGPDCEVKFTAKKAGKYMLEVVNKGPGANTSTLKVAGSKKRPKGDTAKGVDP
jgi:hypothetical protein